MKTPIQIVTPPRGPEDSIRERLCGQFWVRLVLLSNDLPEGPHLEPGTFRPRN